LVQRSSQLVVRGLLKVSFPPNLNDTNIALIAKVDHLEIMKDLHPISLCNVIYKILSKVLTNRLKQILHKCISNSQAAFVLGIDILDNAPLLLKLSII